MSETFAQLISSMVKSSSTKQFVVLVKLIRLLISIITATALYIHYFGQIDSNFTFQSFIRILFNPHTIVWLLFFILLFFGLYPFFSGLVTFIYRAIYPPKGKVSRQFLTTARKGFHMTGIDQKLKTLTVEQLKETNNLLKANLIDSETASVETQGYLLSVLLQYCIFYKVLLDANKSLLCLFIISTFGILIFVFLLLPFSYKISRNLIEDQFKRSIKEAETLQNTSEANTPSI